MVTVNSNIILEAEALSVGESVRIQCPTCGGNGATLSLTRKDDGGVVWQCFRASCPERGARNRTGGLIAGRSTPKPPQLCTYKGELRACTDDELAFLEHKVGWTDEHLTYGRPRWAVDADRYALPIFDSGGNRRGWTLRTWDPKEWTKALTRMDKAEPHLSYYGTHPGGKRIVVEDIPSAVRAAKYINSVALCGTGCGEDYALEIAGCTSDIIWALDADATTLAIRLHRRHQLLFNRSRVIVLDCDLKDMTEPELKALLEVL